MTTYVQKKERVFREKGDGQDERRRTVGEMKRIGSCVDRRAWATSDEERRQHILEFTKAKGAFGTYVPVDVLIDLVCANKNAEIECLQKKIDELEKLLEVYNQLDLTDEQKRKIQQMKDQVYGTADSLESTYQSGTGSESESTTYGVCVGTCDGAPRTNDEPTGDVGAINIDFEIEGSAELQIDVEPVCPPGCDSMPASDNIVDLKCLLAKKDKEIMNLKEQIAILEGKISGSQVTTDLEKKFTHSQLALASAQQEKAQLAKAITLSKAPELLQLEEEIALMRANPNLTPEQETDIIKKELDVLKRYCDQLSNIQEENDQLKLENDYLKQQYGDCGDIEVLRQRSAMLETVMHERDNLQNELKRLAGGMSQEMDVLRRKSDTADQLERDKMELQQQLNEVNRARRQSDFDLESVKSDHEDVQRTMEALRCERDCLRDKLTQIEGAFSDLQRQSAQMQAGNQEAEHTCARMQEEVNRLRLKTKESDVFRLERDRLLLRVEELNNLEVEVLTLVEQVKNLSIERDVLKRQGCELHNIIAEQEHEIKALLLHVDRLSQCVEKQQEKVRSALDDLQSELEHKNFLLATSQEELQDVSHQKLCLTQIENDLKKQIIELTSDLEERDAKIRSLNVGTQQKQCAAMNNELAILEDENKKLRQRIKQLECVCSYNHVDDMLESSKQAVCVVIDEIKNTRAQPSKEDSFMVEENKQLRKHSKDIQNMATERIDQLATQLDDAQKQNEQLRAENEILKSMTKGIETDLKLCISQLEDTMPSSDCDQNLLDQLNMCRQQNDNTEAQLLAIQGKMGAKCDKCQKRVDEELGRCRAASVAIEATVKNLNQIPGAGAGAAASETIDNIQTQLAQCRDANAQLEQQIVDLRNQANLQINSLDDAPITIEEQLEVEMSVRQQLQDENNLLKAELQEQRNINEKLQQTTKKPTETLFTCGAERSCSPEETEFEDSLNNLKEENQKLRATIEVKDALIIKMQQDMNLDVEESDDSTSHKCPASIDTILEQNQTLKRRIAALQKKINESKNIPDNNNNNNTARVAQTTRDCQANLQDTSCTVLVCSLRDEIKSLKTKINESQKNAGKCDNCPIYRAKIAELQNELDNLKNTPTVETKPDTNVCGPPSCTNITSPIPTTATTTTTTTTTTGSNFVDKIQEIRNKITDLEQQLERLSGAAKDSMKPVKGVCSLSGCALKTELKRLREQLKAQPTASSCMCTELKQENLQLKKQIADIQKTDNNKECKCKHRDAQTNVRQCCTPLICALEKQIQQLTQANGALQQELNTFKTSVTKYTPPGPSDTQSLAVCAAKSLASGTELLMENKKLQTQIKELSKELQNLSSVLQQYAPRESENDIRKLRGINVELETQVGELKKEIRKLSQMNFGEPKSGICSAQDICETDNKTLCSRVMLMQQEIENLRECQVGDSTEVECLKKMIIQQEYDVDKLRNENDLLKRTLQEKEKLICLSPDEQTQKIIDMLKQEIAEYKCENNCLRTCLTSTNPSAEMAAISDLGSHTSNKELRSEIEELRKQLDAARQCAAAQNADKELAYLRGRHNELKETIKDLEAASTRACEEFCKSKEKQKLLMDELESLRKTVAELERDNCVLHGELEDTINAMNKRLKDETKALEDKIRLLEDEKARMKREQQELLERLEQSVNRCSAHECELESEIQKLKCRIGQLEKSNEMLECQLAGCKDSLENKALNRIKELEDKVAQLEADKAHLEARLAKMIEEQDELTKKLEDTIREANEREIELESELIKLRAQLKSLEEDNMDLEKQLRDAQDDLSRMEAEILEKFKNLEMQLEALEAANKLLQEEKEKLASENANYKFRIDALEASCLDFENNKGNLSAATLECREELDALRKEHENCQDENKRLLDEIELLKKEKDDLKKEIADLLDKLQICDVNLADAKDKEALEALVKKMELQLKHCDTKCKDTRQLDLELQRLLDEIERLKLQCDLEKRALEEQFEKSLALLKEQYDRDVEFVRGRHSEGIVRLQDMHEDTVSDTVKQYEREIEELQRQVADLLKQKQLDDEIMQRQRDEIERLKNIMDVEIDKCRVECKDLRHGMEDKLLHYEDENTRLKAELEIAKKCCEELDKLKTKLEEEKNKLKSSLTDVTKTSMEEMVKMRYSVDSILQKNEAEMAKMKDYLKSLEAELDKARKDCENEKQQLNAEISRLKSELERAQKCCDDLEKLKNDLEMMNKRGSFSREQLQDELGKMKAQLDLLTSELANERKRLGDEIARLQAELLAAMKCCEELEAIKKNLSRDNKDLESDVEAARKKCMDELERLKKFHAEQDAKYEAIIEQLKKELAEHKKCCEDLEKVKKELENNMKLLKGAGDAEQQYKDNLLKLQKDLENQKNQYELEIARLKRLLDDMKGLEQQIARLKEELAIKQKCCDELEKVKRELEIANENLQKAYANDSSKCEEELARLKAELNNIRKQYEDQIAKLRQELENSKNLINELQKQKSDLENANKALKSQLDSSNSDAANQLSKLKSEFDAARKLLEAEIARLKKELELKQKCCTDLELVQKQLELKTKELNNALAAGNKDCEEELAKLKKELENMRKKYEDELSKLRAELANEQKRAEEALAKLRKELEDQKRRNDELEAIRKKLEQANADTRSKCDENLENCLEELAKLKKDLERNKKRYEDEIDKLKRELAEKSKCCDELENMKKELDKANKALQASKDDANKRAADEINNLKKDLEDTKKRYEEKLDKLRAEMAAERKQFEDEIARLKAELAKNKKCCDDLEEARLALQNERLRLESELNKLRNDLQNEKNNRKNDMDELNKELEKGRKCCKDLEDARKQLEAELKRYEKDLEKLRKDFENELKRSADELAECRKKLNDEKNRYEAEIAKLKKELAEKEKCCEELDNIKNNLLDDANNIKKKYEDELNRLQAEIDKNKKCCEDLEDAKKKLELAKKECEDQLKKLRDELERQAKLIQDLEKEKEQLAANLSKMQSEFNKLKSDMENAQLGNKELQDCRDKLAEEKKRCESEIAKLRALLEKERKCCEELERLKADLEAELNSRMEKMKKEFEDEINRLKEEIKIGKKCCEDLEKAKNKVKSDLEIVRKSLDHSEEKLKKTRDSTTQDRRRTQDSTTQDRRPTRDSTTQDRRPTRDSSTQDTIEEEVIEVVEPKVKVCPCGAIAKERGLPLRDQRQRSLRSSLQQPSIESCITKAQKLNRLSKATALIVEVKQKTCCRPERIFLTKKTVVIANVEPSTIDFTKQIISLEEERPVNLTKSVENILSKALKLGLENLTYDELKDLHLKTRDAVSSFDPSVRSESPLIAESEITLTKLPLQRRISQLENELSKRQKFACDKMCELETKIQTERKQMVDMRNTLHTERKRNFDVTSRLGWENKEIASERDSLKEQASFHEHRLQQLLNQVEQERARSTSLKADLLKARAIEGELIQLLAQNKVQGQCSYSPTDPGRLDKASCPKAKMKEQMRQAALEAESFSKQKSIIDKLIMEESPSRKSLHEDSSQQDSSEGRGDEKKKTVRSKKGDKTKPRNPKSKKK